MERLAGLKHLNCNNNDLSYLSLDGLIHLEILACRNNQLTSLDISEQTQLKLLLNTSKAFSFLFILLSPKF